MLWRASRWVALPVVLLGLYLATGHYVTESNDAQAAAVAAWSWAVRGTAVLPHWAAAQPVRFWVVPGSSGPVSNRFPGAVLSAVPVYWLLGGGFRVFGGVAAAALSTVGCLVVLRSVFRRVAPACAGWAALVAGVGTPLWVVSAGELWEDAGGCLELPRFDGRVD